MKKRRRGRGCLITIIIVAVLAYGLIHTKGEILTTAKDFIQNRILTIFEKPAVTFGDEIKSTHAVLMDLRTGRVIGKKNSDQKTYPASLTKMMTAILAIENLSDLNEKVTVPENIYKELKSEDASMICTQVPSSAVRNSAAEQSSFFFFEAVSTAQSKSFFATKSGRRSTEIQWKADLAA